MEIYLIRHTTPDIEKGTCYGQADIGTTGSFYEEAHSIVQHVPSHLSAVYSSPLQRCRQLAEHLFPQKEIILDDRLKEINCGNWELQHWDDIEEPHLQRWMNDRINVCMPGGESYVQLYNRVVHFFQNLPFHDSLAIVSHGGVIRSLLSYIHNVSIKDSFEAFSIRYGCVIHVKQESQQYRHAILHNPPTEKEQHQPSYY